MTPTELVGYTRGQLNAFFPDGRSVTACDLDASAHLALERFEYNLSHCAGETQDLDVLHSDHYCMYLYFLANSVYNRTGDTRLASKLFYLNKSLHAFNCMYDAELPDIFLLIHVVGTVLGKAKYSNFLVVGQNCTVGALRGEYPVLGERLILGAGASIIGPCHVGDDVMLAPGARVFASNIPNNSLVSTQTEVVLKPYNSKAARTYFKLS